MLKTRIILIAVMLLSCVAASSCFSQAKVVRYSQVFESLALGDSLQLIEDRHSEFTADQILEGRYDYQWVPNANEVPNFGYTKSTFWYRITLLNDSEHRQARLFEIAYPLLDKIDFYLLDQDQHVKRHVATGDRTPFNTRDIAHRNFLFDIDLLPNEKVDVLLRIQTEGAHQVPLNLWQERAFFLEDQKELLIKAVFYGILTVMILFNLFIYFSLRETSYLYYVGFVTCFLFMQIAMHGISYEYFWPGLPYVHDISILFFVPTTMLFACLFTMEFLELRRSFKLLFNFLVACTFINVLSIIGSFFLPYALSTKISVGMVIPQSLAIMIAGPILWFRGEKTARFFTLAWFALVVGTTAAAMNKFGLLPRNFITENGLLFGAALEVILLSFALADRFNNEREQRFLAQKEKLAEARHRRDIEDRMMRQATHNPLTQLPNRILLQKRLAEIIDDLRNTNDQIAIVLIHLKRFHEINKTLGHQNADELLRLVSIRLSDQAARIKGIFDVEIAEDRTFPVATIEGVTFALILRANDTRDTEQNIEYLTRQIIEPIDYKGMSIDVGVSVGVAFYPEHGSNVDTLLRHAHIAIDMADKNDNQIAIYSKQMNPYNARRLTLMGDLSRAIDEDKLSINFQPQVDLKTNRVNGMEALVRWTHEIHGFIPPDEFIPLAEQTGIIKALTQWVLEKSVAFCAALAEQGHHMTVSVNISAMNLRERHFAESVSQVIQSYNIEPAQLVLEVTETAMMDDEARALKALMSLNELGIRLSIDDFGTGHSSLGYIKKLPVHEIKIDRSFVMEMDKDLDDEVIVKTTLKMCHSLGYEVVAEGVENLVICNRLRELGCDVIQGYFIARPMPSKDFIEWLASRAWKSAANDTPT